MRDGLEYGFSIPSQPANVEYVNSLQALHSQRFVFSNQAKFTIVEEMIAKTRTCDAVRYRKWYE